MDLSLFEPITRDTLSELRPGEWIWDNKDISRRIHKRTIGSETVVEPIGFRQIDILDFDVPSSKPFMLSNIDDRRGYEWTYFEEGRFYRLKGDKQCNSDQTDNYDKMKDILKRRFGAEMKEKSNNEN